MAEEISFPTTDERTRSLALAEARLDEAPENEIGAEAPDTRIKTFEASMMIALAAVCDFLGAIPLVGSLVGGFAWGAIGFWVWWNDLKRPPNVLMMNAAKLIPIIGIMPVNILSVVFIIRHHNRMAEKPLS